MLPAFVGIGAMRCGTTTLWELLGRHRRVFLGPRKEIHFFDDRDGNFGRGLGWYGAHFEKARPDQLAGECSPSYLFVEGTAERMRRALPDARLLAILRDPVERAWSHYWYMVERGHEGLSFEAALAAEEERLRTGGPWPRLRYSYLARGRYFEQLRRFEAVFPRGQLAVVLLEELRADPAASMTAVFRHLGLEPQGIDLSLPTPLRNRGRSPRLRRLHHAACAALSWSEERRALATRGMQLLAGAERRLNVASGLPRLNVATRARLAAAFADGNAELQAWLGRPLPASWRVP